MNLTADEQALVSNFRKLDQPFREDLLAYTASLVRRHESCSRCTDLRRPKPDSIHAETDETTIFTE